MLSNEAITQLVGHEAFARARVYARSGHVSNVELDDEAMVITGRVRGTYRDDYAVTVHLANARSGAVTAYRTRCSCPVVTDCKHAAAVLLVAQHLVAAAQLVERPEWEKRLERLVAGTPTPAIDIAPLALEFGVERIPAFRGYVGRQDLRIRPARLGKAGAWVRSGIGWDDLDFVTRSYVAEHRDLLLQFRAAAGRQRPVCPAAQRLAVPAHREQRVLEPARPGGSARADRDHGQAADRTDPIRSRRQGRRRPAGGPRRRTGDRSPRPARPGRSGRARPRCPGRPGPRPVLDPPGRGRQRGAASGPARADDRARTAADDRRGSAVVRAGRRPGALPGRIRAAAAAECAGLLGRPVGAASGRGRAHPRRGRRSPARPPRTPALDRALRARDRSRGVPGRRAAGAAHLARSDRRGTPARRAGAAVRVAPCGAGRVRRGRVRRAGRAGAAPPAGPGRAPRRRPGLPAGDRSAADPAGAEPAAGFGRLVRPQGDAWRWTARRCRSTSCSSR